MRNPFTVRRENGQKEEKQRGGGYYTNIIQLLFEAVACVLLTTDATVHDVLFQRKLSQNHHMFD